MFDLPLEPVYSLVVIVAGFLYLGGLERVRVGLSRLRREPARAKAEELPSVSVIIPCRNEASHLGAALDDLASQDYPPERLEIIMVDDRSVDGTGEIARRFGDRLHNLTVLRIDSCPDHLSPKKHALALGLSHAKAEFLITTDGDCRFQRGWIRSLISHFTPETGLVTGLTVFDRGQKEPFWQRMQQLDYLSHSFLAAGALGSGMALNCNGSNLAMRREAFFQAGGYDRIGSTVTGDDTLLLQRLQRSTQWRIIFTADPSSIVHSWPEETPHEVFHQRLRWGSGGLSYTLPALAFGLSSFVFFVALLFSPWLWLAGWIAPVWAIFVVLKIMQEGRVMARGFRIFGLRPDWLAFAILELIHIPAILTFSLGGHLAGFYWKGEKYQRRRSRKIESAQSTAAEAPTL